MHFKPYSNEEACDEQQTICGCSDTGSFVCSLPDPGTATGRDSIVLTAGDRKKIRQVRVQFSEPMVAFGDPRAVLAPFNIRCSEKGTARWSDASNWLYDFERDLPAGIQCEFNVKDGLKTLRGADIAGQRQFQFSTGGPAILNSSPYQGDESVSDDQIFVLELDSPATESSVLANVTFSVDRISERIGIRVVSGQERESILKAQYPWRGAKRPDNLLLDSGQTKIPGQFKDKPGVGPGCIRSRRHSHRAGSASAL